MKKPDKGDMMMITGIGMIGGGLWLWMPWVALTVVGTILLMFGFFMPGETKGGN